MSPTSRRAGHLGEAAAVEELSRRGYAILARNYRCGGGEADIVAHEGGELVFIEVKTRSRLDGGLPRDAVGWTKQMRLVEVARHYCHHHGGEDRPVRFDVVEVVLLRGEVAGVEVIRDAFAPPG